MYEKERKELRRRIMNQVVAWQNGFIDLEDIQRMSMAYIDPVKTLPEPDPTLTFAEFWVGMVRGFRRSFAVICRNNPRFAHWWAVEWMPRFPIRLYYSRRRTRRRQHPLRRKR